MIISEFDGGLLSIDESCLEKRIVEPQTEYFGIEQYPRLFQKASVYLYKITIAHCLLMVINVQLFYVQMYF